MHFFLFNLSPEKTENSSIHFNAKVKLLLLSKQRVMSSAYCSVLTPVVPGDCACVMLLTFLSFLILMDNISRTRTKSKGLTQHPCLTPLLALNHPESQPPFLTALSALLRRVETYCRNSEPKLNFSNAKSIDFFDTLSKALKKSNDTITPLNFFLLGILNYIVN